MGGVVLDLMREKKVWRSYLLGWKNERPKKLKRVQRGQHKVSLEVSNNEFKVKTGSIAECFLPPYSTKWSGPQTFSYVGDRKRQL